MKIKGLQCKHIPTLPILEFLIKKDFGEEWRIWATWYGLDNEEVLYKNSVQRAMPPGLDANLVRAKMGSLIARGLVDGCACGCRGDFTITEKGINYNEYQTN